MSKNLQGFTALLIIALMVSCNGNPFMNNIFSGIDVYELPESFESAEEILDQAGDDGFLDALAENDQLAEEVITMLDDKIDKPASEATSEDQEAALLLADVHLATSEADDTINNVNDLLVDAVNDPESMNFDSPETIVTDLFQIDPALPQVEQEAAVAKQLEAFMAAADALSFYGGTINAGSEPSPEANAGETAATAMIAGMTTFMIDSMVESADNSINTQEEAIDALVGVILNGGTMPSMAEPTDGNGDPLPADATTGDMLNAMLGGDLAEVVNQGFDLSAFENM